MNGDDGGFPVLRAGDVVKAFPDLHAGDILKVSQDEFTADTRFDEFDTGLVVLLEVGPPESADIFLTKSGRDSDVGDRDGRPVRVADLGDQMVVLEVLGLESSGGGT